MRLIDADELKIYFGFTWDDIAPTREEMFEIIDRQPTAEPKTGRWIPRDWNETNCKCRTLLYCLPKCSVCGYSADYTNYCPNCGARMEGDTDATD